MTEFDAAARDKIRLALLAYLKRHSIGVPTLAKRIKESNPREPHISVKTLQRFLSKQGRSFDMHVGFYEQFVAGHNVRDTAGEMGLALSAFYGDISTQDYEGTYTQVVYDVAPSRVRISRAENFWRVDITEANHGHRILTGAMVQASGTAFVVLKDVLTGLPSSYSLLGDGYLLVGTGFSSRLDDADVFTKLEKMALKKESANGI